jgi:hypothetical protein
MDQNENHFITGFSNIISETGLNQCDLFLKPKIKIKIGKHDTKLG